MCDMLAEEAFEQGRVDLACTAADLAADCWRELGEARRAEPSGSRVASDD